jgi:hypothetical protein
MKWNVESMQMTEQELENLQIFCFNTGLKQAQWQVTKAMFALDVFDLAIEDKEKVKVLLKFIRDEIGKEMK